MKFWLYDTSPKIYMWLPQCWFCQQVLIESHLGLSDNEENCVDLLDGYYKDKKKIFQELNPINANNIIM